MRLLCFCVIILSNLTVAHGADSTGIVRGRVYDRATP